MKMEEMTINGKVYVPKESIEKVSKDQKKKGTLIDPANVMMLILLPEEPDVKKVLKLEHPADMTFKFAGEFNDGETVIDTLGAEYYRDVKTKTKFSKDYFGRARKTYLSWMGMTNKANVGSLWISYNEEKKEFVKDMPVVFQYDRMIFLLAPRVDD